jgi:hypothetical protein
VPLFLIATLVAPTALAADNLALGKSYTFSRPPLYDLTRDDGDARQLTDGKLAPGTMWMSRDSVGWMADDLPISIEIDLGKEQAIGRICLRTARGKSAGVSFPRRVDLLVSADKVRYAWGGRLTPLADAGEGGYLAKEFCSGEIGRRGRFVRLQVATHGAFLFSDEISVWAAASTSARSPSVLIAADAVKTFILEHEAISLTVATLRARYADETRTQPAHERLQQVAHLLEGTVADLDPAGLRTIDDEIRAIVREALLVTEASVRITRADPWRLATPIDGASLPAPTARLDIPAGGHGALALAIEHVQADGVAFSISAIVVGGAGTMLTVTPFEVAIVTRADGVRMGDPLVPLRGGRIMVPAGTTRQLWLDLHAAAGAKTMDGVVTVQVEAQLPSGLFQRSLQFPISIYALTAPDAAPATVAWGYLDSPIVRDRPAAAARDMLEHGINTAVIPAWHHLPWPKAGAKPGAAEIGDYRQFDSVMKHLAGHRQYLFFLSFNGSSNMRGFDHRQPFLSDGWKALFVAWIKEWTGRLRAAGHSYDSFAFYPVDEPHPGGEHDALAAVATLIKQADPRLRIYTTLHEPEALTDALVEAVDMFQLNGRALEAQTVARLQSRGKAVWSYATTGGGKTGHPAAFYRAQAWDAFALGLTGFGFWAYADSGLSGSAWNDIDDVRPDFAVIYDSPAGTDIISSKRWEAWREGIQDFALLTAARQAVGDDDAARQRIALLAREGRDKIANIDDLAAIRGQLRAIATGSPTAKASR